MKYTAITAMVWGIVFFCIPSRIAAKNKKVDTTARLVHKNEISLSFWYRFDPRGISYGGGDFFFRSRPKSALNNSTGEQISFTYTRQLHKSFGASVQYTFWKKQQDYWGYRELIAPDDRVKGWVTRRWSYQHIDLMGSYHLKLYRRHSVDFFGGLSYAIGWDKVVDDQEKDRASGWYPYYFFNHNRRSDYLGGVAQMKYDYSFWKRRMSIGFNANFRAYYQFQQPMFGGGLHASVNF